LAEKWDVMFELKDFEEVLMESEKKKKTAKTGCDAFHLWKREGQLRENK